MVAFVVLRNKAIKPLLVGAALGRAADSRNASRRGDFVKRPERLRESEIT
jgi:hypothetical protein